GRARRRLARPCFLGTDDQHALVRGGDAPCAGIRGRLERVRRATRRRKSPPGIGLRELHHGAASDRGAGSADAAVGGAWVRPGPKEEKEQRHQEGGCEEAGTRETDRETVDAVAPPAHFP